MGVLLFFGSLGLVFGPVLSVFWFVTKRNNLDIIYLLAGSFSWMTSMFFAGVFWVIVPNPGAVIAPAVIFQEAFRFLMYRFYDKVTIAVSAPTQAGSRQLQPIKFLSASLSIGVGIAGSYVMIMYTSLLTESTGPGTFLGACDTSIFVVSGVLTLMWSLLHILWNVIAFDSFRQLVHPSITTDGTTSAAIGLAVVYITHLAVAFTSLANIGGGSCVPNIVTALAATIFVAGAAYRVMTKYAEMSMGG